MYEYGLAEAQDFDDFNAKLVSLKEKWESLCPGFYAWFLKKEKFEKSVIASAREGTNVGFTKMISNPFIISKSLVNVSKNNQLLM